MKISILLMLIIFSATPASADTVYLKNGKETKGVVVEEYIDRIKLSTVDGEIVILKSEIKDILYDLPVQNLIKLGDFHKQKGNFNRAYLYYHKAYKTDPNFKPAVLRYLEIRSLLLKLPQEELEKSVQRQKALLDASAGIVQIKEGISNAAEETLKKDIGIELIAKDGKPFVRKVYFESPAYNSGIKEADFIIAVWNRLTGYMELADVCDMLLDTKTGEINLTIERKVKLVEEKNTKYIKEGVASLGFSLGMTEKGLTITRALEESIAAQCGLLNQDVIEKIADKPTRYTPLNKAISLIESKGKNVEITIHREITLWKKWR